MAAVPTDISASQAEALSTAPATPITPHAPPGTEAIVKTQKQKKTKQSTEAGGVAEAPQADATPSGRKHDDQRTGEAGNKKMKTPWYVERTERQLRQRENQSIVFLTKKLVLQSHHAQDVLARTGKSWSESMITLSETMRNFKPETQCLVVDAEVDRLMEECLKAIKVTSERMNKTAEAHGIDLDEVDVEYTKPAEYQLRVLSPREYRFHSLLMELDNLCALIDKLWLLKLVPDRSRSQIPFETKRQIMRLVNRVRTLVYRAQASSQRAGAPDAADPRAGTVLDPNAPQAAAEVKQNEAAHAEGVSNETAAIEETTVATA